MNLIALTKAVNAVRDLPAGALTPAGAFWETDGCLILQLKLSPEALEAAEKILPEFGVKDPLPELVRQLQAKMGSQSTPEGAPKV